MAEENRSSRTTFEDGMFMLFAVMLVTNALQRVPTILQDHLGIDIGSKYLVAAAAVTATTPLGTSVVTIEGTPYYASAQDTQEPAGTFAPGTTLFLSDGPEKAAFGGGNFWYVEDTETGAIGWVPEDALVQNGVGGISADTKRGTLVRALMDVSVWDVPGSATATALMVKGERATITNGPRAYLGSRWWFVDRTDDAVDGWITEGALTLASELNWRSGSVVRAVHDTDLFDRAGGGRVLGTLHEGEQGKVVSGPTSVGGSYWWLVESDEGIQGWAAEVVLEDGGVRGWLRGFLAVVLVIGTILTVGLLGGIAYATIRTNQIRAKETRRIRDAIPKTMQPKRNDRWDTVMTHVSSENPNDWRLAIIEADVMLDELIMRMGYIGTTLGDRLKQIARGDMKTLDAAWEAHRVRNQVAHAGSDFILTKREARRVIDLYGAVFAEFKFI